jgi:hypothetical protein
MTDNTQPEAQEPVAWESTTPGYIKYITQARYEKFSPNVQRWYKPYKCSSCAAPQPAPLRDDVVRDAARYRWLRNKSTVLHGTAWLGSATAYQRDVDFLRRDDALAALDAAIDAAIAAQGGNDA